MKIVSWNINGIRSNIICDGKFSGRLNEYPKSNLKNLIDKHNPDIICFQETKCGLDTGEKINVEMYPYRYWNESKGEGKRGKGYSGTSIWSKIKPKNVYNSYNEFVNNHGRFQLIEFTNFSLINIYVPNSGTNFEYRTNIWDKSIKKLIDDYKSKPLIITGDFNVVNNEIDMWNPDTYNKHKSPGIFKEEIEMFNKYLENYTDCFRYKYPDKKEYTWWDMRSKGREKGNGWRIDYFLINNKYADMIKDSMIDNSIYGSDHCPIILEI